MEFFNEKTDRKGFFGKLGKLGILLASTTTLGQACNELDPNKPRYECKREHLETFIHRFYPLAVKKSRELREKTFYHVLDRAGNPTGATIPPEYWIALSIVSGAANQDWSRKVAKNEPGHPLTACFGIAPGQSYHFDTAEKSWDSLLNGLVLAYKSDKPAYLAMLGFDKFYSKNEEDFDELEQIVDDHGIREIITQYYGDSPEEKALGEKTQKETKTPDTIPAELPEFITPVVLKNIQQVCKANNVCTSITIAQMIHEGTKYENGKRVMSDLSLYYNNFFGHKCGQAVCNHRGGADSPFRGPCTIHADDEPDDKFRYYRSMQACIEAHAQWFSNGKRASRYALLFDLDRNDYKGWAHGLRKYGYATDPDYANKLIRTVERYNLDQLD